MTEVSELDREARWFGIDPSALRSSPTETGLWPSHVAAAQALVTAQTQWRMVGGMGSMVTGLDYDAARTAWELAGITVAPAEFLELQVMESAAVAEMNRRPS